MEREVLITKGTQRWQYLFLFVVVFCGLLVRLNNLTIYNTWWSEDGGAHLLYVEKVARDWSLPMMDYQPSPSGETNYLAWHEPGYYVLMAAWTWLGGEFTSSDTRLDWQELFQVLVYLFSVWVVWRLAGELTGSRYLKVLGVLVTAFLFVGLKLTAYLNNEYLAQSLILFLIYLFLHWRLFEGEKMMKLAWWSVILALGMLVKLTVVLPGIAAGLVWVIFGLKDRRKKAFVSILLSTFIILCLQTPWLVYKKQEFGKAWTINVFEKDNQQSLLASTGWKTLVQLNTQVIYSRPFWPTTPYSFSAILLADIFADYYGVFSHPGQFGTITGSDLIFLPSKRYTDLSLWQRNLFMIRWGLLIVLSWSIGLGAWFWSWYRQKKIESRDVFLGLLLLGGIMALVYNLLRYPYPERGVIKASFVFYLWPLLTLVAGQAGQILAGRWWLAVNYFLWFIYLIFSWPVIWLLWGY